MIAALAILALLAGAPAEPWKESPSVPAQWLGKARPRGELRRIVTVAPSLTELLFALELGERVVGVSRFDDFPAEVEKLPKVGGFLDPNVEAIIGLKPDLVLAVPNAGNRPSLERIASLGAPVYVVPGNTFADIFVSIRAVSALFPDAVKKRGAALESRLIAELVALEARAKDRTPPKVAIVYGWNPLILAGTGSFADTIVRALGGQNIVRSGPPYPHWAVEELVASAPDVIIDASEVHGMSSPTPFARFPQIPAVKHDRVHRVPLGAILRPSPRLIEGLTLLSGLLHPDADLKKKP